MQKKLTIRLDEAVYPRAARSDWALQDQPVRGIGGPPHLMPEDLDEAYRELARDERREAEALEWSEATISERRSSSPRRPVHRMDR